ncbi:hypothetical protein VX037_11640 [Gordonia sp. Z-3]|nr:hypothetical protein [Gordonia sp. Z-3]
MSEAVKALGDAMQMQVDVDGEPGKGLFTVEAGGWPFRLTVCTEARVKKSGEMETVIIDLRIEPRRLLLTAPITKKVVRDLPFGALIDVGAALLASGPLGAFGVVPRPRLGIWPEVKSGPRGLKAEFFQDVADAARFAARERQRLGRGNAPSVEEYVAKKFGTNSPNTAKGWLKQARSLGLLAPGELRNPDAYVRDSPNIDDVPPHLRLSTYIDEEGDQ